MKTLNNFNIAFIIAIFAYISTISTAFVNQVADPVPANKTGNVYKFELTLTHGVTMGFYSSIKEMFTPVFYNQTENAYYLMDPDMTKPCNAMTKMTNQTEIDTIVKASGLKRPIILVNGMFPGPPIVVPHNAQVEITVHNRLMMDSASIHWHGQVQKGTFFHDGVTHITQCPINPGDSYTYKFNATRSGTHFYHAHSGVLRTEGVYGPLIVKEEATKSNSNYTKEFLVLLQEWFLDESINVYNEISWRNLKYFSPNTGSSSCAWRNRNEDGTFLPTVPFHAVLINGKGWHDLSRNELDVKDDVFDLPLEEYVVQPNKKYLFRIMSATMAQPIEIRVSGHQMTLVATDGNKIKPIKNVDTLIIQSGERYDIEIETKPENESGNFLIYAKTIQKYDFFFQKVQTQLFGIARLRYENTEKKNIISAYPKECNSTDPCIVANCYHAFNKTIYKCVSPDKFESESIPEEDKELLKTQYNDDEFEEYFLNFALSGNPVNRVAVNNFRFMRPTIPPFFKKNSSDAIINCPKTCDSPTQCKCTYTIKVKPGKVVQFVMFNMGKTAHVNNTAHPIHLHGHHFYVMKMGFPQYDPNTGFVIGNNQDINCNSSDPNFCNTNIYWTNKQWSHGNVSDMSSNPAQKDTLLVPMAGYAVVRFKSDNVGLWFIHCHFETHTLEGMAMVIQEGSDEEIRNLVKWDEINTCSHGYEAPRSSSIAPTSSAISISYQFYTSFVLCLFIYLFI